PLPRPPLPGQRRLRSPGATTWRSPGAASWRSPGATCHARNRHHGKSAPGCPGARGRAKELGPMRLVFCDDNRILCEALGAAMEARGHEVVAITAAVADGLAAVGAHRPDAVLLGVRAAVGAGGLSAAGAMRQHYPDTAVLVLCGVVDRPTWLAAMKIGVAGFLCKDQNVGDVAGAL